MDKKFDIIVLTEDRYELPTELTEYKKNVILEDALLLNALTLQGLRVGRFSWSNKDFDWSSTRAVIFRTTWDYFDRFSEFKIWLDSIKHKVLLFNEYPLIFWNQDKSYLRDLEEEGIRIPPTQFIKKGSQRKLSEIALELPYSVFILKPNISGAARHTYKIAKENVTTYDALFSELISQEDFIIQEYQHNITKRGEISLIIIDGTYTHAVLKKAKEGDFRVQDDFGGSAMAYYPNRDEIEFAEKCVGAVKGSPLYCRVDLMWDNENQLVLSEIEMIEPELWFRTCPSSADCLAQAIARKLK